MIENFAFTTEVPDHNPSANFKGHNSIDQEQSLYNTLKKTKEKAKLAERQFKEEMINHHKAKRSLDMVNHKSLIKRIEFLKIYSNKKAMFQGRQMLETRRQERQKNDRRSADVVKRRKLEGELQLIFRQNQEEENAYRMQLLNKKDKELFQKQKMLAHLKERANLHHDEIKRRGNQFMIRKKNMHTSITQRSKNNYHQKVRQQLTLIHEYQNIMSEVQQYFRGTQEIFKDNSTMCQTLQPGRTVFLTSKPTFEL